MIAKFQSGASQIRDSTPQGSLPRMQFGREICSLANVEQRETMLAARGNVTLPIIKERSGLAARHICSCAFACVQRPNPNCLVSRAVCKSCA